MQKEQPMHPLVVKGAVVMGLGIMLHSAPLLAAEEGRDQESKPHAQGEKLSGADLQSRRAQVRARMDERQSKLDELAARMNQATGQEKVNAMAALLNEIVGQQKALRDRIADRMSSHKNDHRYGAEGSSKTPDTSQ
jgi:hypothetical protein